MITEKNAENALFFLCEKCNFKCCKKSNYTKHLATRKHKNNYTSFENAGKKLPTKNICNCGREYMHRQGLYVHKKKCNVDEIKPDEINPDEIKPYEIKPDDNQLFKIMLKENFDFKTLILEVVKNNSELQKQTNDLQKANMDLQQQVLDVCQKIQPMTINSHNNNKTFNLQFFLNETCKDAMNIMDFVDSFTLQLSDLEDVSKQGYVDGISNIIMKKLNELDVHKRPIHCSDAKREIMYVKDQNKWEKEDLGYTKLRKAIKYISKKNSDLLGQWSEAHPASKNITTQTNTEYMQMIVQAMGGRGEIGENESKIIKKIAKTVLIEKD
jgi:hypothetical protein